MGGRVGSVRIASRPPSPTPIEDTLVPHEHSFGGRLYTLIIKEKLRLGEFCKRTELDHSTVLDVIRTPRRGMTSHSLRLIADEFPHWDIRWLICGGQKNPPPKRG